MKYRYIKNEIITHKCSYTERITNFPLPSARNKETKRKLLNGKFDAWINAVGPCEICSHVLAQPSRPL